MARQWQITMWIAGGLVLVGLGVWGAVANLDAADKIASVASAIVGMAGLGVSGYGIVLARRGPATGGQSVTGSTVCGQVTQVRNVRGSVRIGPAASGPKQSQLPYPQPAGSAGPTGSDSGGQSVTGSQVAGPLDQVDGVGGDVDVDR